LDESLRFDDQSTGQDSHCVIIRKDHHNAVFLVNSRIPLVRASSDSITIMVYQLITTLTRYNSARVGVKPVSQQDTQTPTSDDRLVVMPNKHCVRCNLGVLVLVESGGILLDTFLLSDRLVHDT